METLRLILIAVGVLLIIGIYAGGKWSRRKHRQATPLTADERTLAVESSSAPAQDETMSELDPEVAAEEEVEPPTILALHLMAAPETLIPGEALFQTFAELGLELGEMDIFHARVTGEDEPIFSIANVVKPGTFRVSEMAQLQSPGLVLFMQLPGPDAPMQAFDHMMAIAQEVCERLDLVMLDGRRQPLDDAGIEQMRGQVTRFC